jgi:hypothetical protein
MLVLYHRTTRAAADAILRGGFGKEADCSKSAPATGVWLSDVPLEDIGGTEGEVLLRLVLPTFEEELDAFEWAEEMKPYREWRVPVELINALMTVEEVEQPADQEASIAWASKWT